MKVTHVTASYSHQFNDPDESFANHRFSVSLTAEIQEGEAAGGVLDKLQAHCEEEVQRERTIVEVGHRFNRDLAWASNALRELNSKIEEDGLSSDASPREIEIQAECVHDRPIVEEYYQRMKDHRDMMVRDDLWREDPYPPRPTNLKRTYYCPF